MLVGLTGTLTAILFHLEVISRALGEYTRQPEGRGNICPNNKEIGDKKV